MYWHQLGVVCAVLDRVGWWAGSRSVGESVELASDALSVVAGQFEVEAGYRLDWAAIPDEVAVLLVDRVAGLFDEAVRLELVVGAGELGA